MKEIFDQFLKDISSDPMISSFEAEYWDGDIKKYGTNPASFRIILKNPQTAKRILTEKSIGVGEEYMNGNLKIEGSLQSFLELGYSRAFSSLKPSFGTTIKIALSYLIYPNTIKKSKLNAIFHYDKGVDFYSLWLDKGLTYSCAYYKNENDTLEQAQQNKYEHISRKLMLKERENLIDIGCGFGGMLIYAVKNYGVSGVGYTLSKDQYREATKRIKDEKLEKKIKIYLKDYREVKGKFDKFVSIGMFEHVGKKHYGEFFKKIKEILKEDGIGVLHTIGLNKDIPTDPWIRKYIFPGGELPVIQNIIDSMGKFNLNFTDIENLRFHYHKTLEEWIKRFEKNIEKVRKMYNEEFVRMWRLYLSGSSSAFFHGGNNLYQITFANEVSNKLPLTREYIYK